jgi:hypothetical protein
VEEQAVPVIGKVSQGDLGFRALDADGANEDPHLVLLVLEEVLNPDANLGFRRIGFCSALGMGSPLGFLLWIRLTLPFWCNQRSFAWLWQAVSAHTSEALLSLERFPIWLRQINLSRCLVPAFDGWV